MRNYWLDRKGIFVYVGTDGSIPDFIIRDIVWDTKSYPEMPPIQDIVWDTKSYPEMPPIQDIVWDISLNFAENG